MTNDITRRMAEHRERKVGAYSAQYGIDRLVYYEHTKYVLNAIARENELKDWNRAKKISLIESVNPTWQDLSEDWGASNRSFLRRVAKGKEDAAADSSAALRNDNQKS